MMDQNRAVDSVRRIIHDVACTYNQKGTLRVLKVLRDIIDTSIRLREASHE